MSTVAAALPVETGPHGLTANNSKEDATVHQLNLETDPSKGAAATRIADALTPEMSLEEALQQRCLVQLAGRPVQHLDVFIREVVTTTVSDISNAVELLLERLLLRQKFCEPLRQLMSRVTDYDVNQLISAVGESHAARRWEAVQAEVQKLHKDASQGLSDAQQARVETRDSKVALHGRCDVLEQSAAVMKVELSRTRQETIKRHELHDALANNTKQVQFLEGKLETLNNDMTVVKDRLERVELALRTLAAKVTGDLAGLRSDMATLDARITDSHSRLGSTLLQAIGEEQQTRTMQLERADARLKRCEAQATGTCAAIESCGATQAALLKTTESRLVKQLETCIADLRAEIAALQEDCHSKLQDHKHESAFAVGNCASLAELHKLQEEWKMLGQREHSQHSRQEDAWDLMQALAESDEARAKELRRLRWEFDEMRAHNRGDGSETKRAPSSKVTGRLRQDVQRAQQLS